MKALRPLPLLAEPAGEILHGVLPWRMARKSGLRILLVGSVDGEWTVPAGAPVAERASFLSAALHAFEEAGIIGEIDTVPLHGSADTDLLVFAMKVRGTLSHWKRQGERQRRWFSPQEAAGLVRDPALAAAIRAFAGDAGAADEKGQTRAAGTPQPAQLSP
ncbi:MAG: NUDIX hydrolase [Aquamicrobium sp.]|uniref:NUDIX hydrolase n=1 Tax=Aquamicrobium sp. TaxID=1872579 RepID=UPI00349EF141|nr:NUDIX hydrolase [Aquamicrobium sp.]